MHPNGLAKKRSLVITFQNCTNFDWLCFLAIVVVRLNLNIMIPKIEIEQHQKIESKQIIINVWINGGVVFKFISKEKLSNKKINELKAYIERHINNLLRNINIDFF